MHSADALDFVKRLTPNLGWVFGTRILKPVLFQIPKQGSINIHKRKYPTIAAAVRRTLELLDDQKKSESPFTASRKRWTWERGSFALIPIEPLDDLESLALRPMC